MLRQPEQLLHADVQRRRAGRLIVDGVAIARRCLEVRRSLSLEPTLQIPRQQRIERGAQFIGA